MLPLDRGRGLTGTGAAAPSERTATAGGALTRSARPRHGALAADPAGLGEVARAARKGDAAGLETAARSFEGMLVGQMLKQMRSAKLSEDGPFDSEQTKLYQDFQDQETARAIGEGPGLGIREALLRQLGKSSPTAPEARPAGELRLPERNPRLLRIRPASQTEAAAGAGEAAESRPRGSGTERNARVGAAAGAGAAAAAAVSSGTWPPATPQEFVAYLKPHADAAARELGIDGSVLLAQSALETAWGRRVPRHGDGRSSFNLFGIKADRAWQGDRVAVGTLEYRDGAPRRERAKFRAYASPVESFQDYVAFLRRNPRYRAVLASDSDREFVQGLQRAGYATDPAYANKILGIHARIQELARAPRAAPLAQVSTAAADSSNEA